MTIAMWNCKRLTNDAKQRTFMRTVLTSNKSYMVSQINVSIFYASKPININTINNHKNSFIQKS